MARLGGAIWLWSGPVTSVVLPSGGGLWKRLWVVVSYCVSPNSTMMVKILSVSSFEEVDGLAVGHRDDVALGPFLARETRLRAACSRASW